MTESKTINEIENLIKAKRKELKIADKRCEKYRATVPVDPLSVFPPVMHNAQEMDNDYSNRDRIEQEYWVLKERRASLKEVN